jgi:hypothetical protein
VTDSATLPVTAPIQSPTSARDARVDRYLARVATLSPRDWGELDAIGQRFAANDPLAWWERSRRMAAMAARYPAVEDFVSVVGFVVNGASDVARLIRGGPERTWRARTPRAPNASPEVRAFLARFETLQDTAASQPGGPGAAMHCLVIGLIALWMRDTLTPDGFARMYELVEPVIPATSL